MCGRDRALSCAHSRASAQAKVVIHGHLHTDLHRTVGNADIYCTPSTCHQTKQVSPQWEKEPGAPPGFRHATNAATDRLLCGPPGLVWPFLTSRRRRRSAGC